MSIGKIDSAGTFYERAAGWFTIGRRRARLANISSRDPRRVDATRRSREATHRDMGASRGCLTSDGPLCPTAPITVASEGVPPAYQAGGVPTTTGHWWGRRDRGPPGETEESREILVTAAAAARRSIFAWAYSRKNRKSFVILCGVQTHRNRRLKPQNEKYLRSVLGAADTLDVACDASACLLRQSLGCQLTGPDNFESRIGSTGVDAEPWDPPAIPACFRLPALLSAPYARHGGHGVAEHPSARPAMVRRGAASRVAGSRQIRRSVGSHK
jgi:hypothetical protein